MNIRLLKKIRDKYEIRYEDNKYIVIDNKAKTAIKRDGIWMVLQDTLKEPWYAFRYSYATIYHRRLMQRNSFNEQNKLFKNITK